MNARFQAGANSSASEFEQLAQDLGHTITAGEWRIAEVIMNHVKTRLEAHARWLRQAAKPPATVEPEFREPVGELANALASHGLEPQDVHEHGLTFVLNGQRHLVKLISEDDGMAFPEPSPVPSAAELKHYEAQSRLAEQWSCQWLPDIPE